jgi:methylated-DNA-[protein]-cysteine S-methyltransferase
MAVKTAVWKSPVGELLLGQVDQSLVLCDWRYRKMRSTIDRRIQEPLGPYQEAPDDSFLQEVIHQLEEYFEGQRKSFDVSVNPVGTDFQKRVWRILGQIPYGSTLSYQALSEELGDPKAIRAVASANGANALSILYPCHRIIGSDGSLVGYAGGLQAKEALLRLEGSLVDQQLSLFS